tara:strand:- start:210 stop:452 length:243 start_codon:yes stop_codon:yes gene_type:complete
MDKNITVFLENISEKIIDNLDFKNEDEVDIFIDKLKETILEYLDPDFEYSSEDSEDFTELKEPIYKINTDKDGFKSLVFD